MLTEPKTILVVEDDEEIGQMFEMVISFAAPFCEGSVEIAELF